MNRPDLEQFFMVRRERIKRSTFLEQELLVHEIFGRIWKNGLPPCYYTEEDLERHLQYVRTLNSSFSTSGLISLYTGNNMGVRLGRPFAEKYFPFDELSYKPDDMRRTIKHGMTCKKVIYVAVQKVVKTTSWDLTISSVRRMLGRMGFGEKYHNPIAYKVIFRQLLKPNGRIVSDLKPGLGMKALACMSLGAKYHPMTPFPANFAEDIGLELADPGPKHDILLIDNGFKRVDIDEAMSWRAKCREMLVYVERDQMEEARIKYRPTRIIKVKTRLATAKHRLPDFLFHFS